MGPRPAVALARRRVKASARVAVERRGDSSEVVDRRAQAPLSIRRCGARVLIASSAAMPVGGDELELMIDVGPGARADIGSVAAGMVWPGIGGVASQMTTVASVAAGGRLDLWLEPTISVVGSRHRMTTRVELDRTASARVVEEVVLGRSGQVSGDLTLSVRIERAGGPLVHHQERFGPDAIGAGSSVGVGGARHVLSAVLVGVVAGPSRVWVEPDRAGAWMPMGDDVVVVMAAGHDRPGVLELLARLAPELTAEITPLVASGSRVDDDETMTPRNDRQHEGGVDDAHRARPTATPLVRRR